MPCLVCGSRTLIEADHIKPVSLKTLGFTRRTHKGLGAFFAVPLCQKHHREKTRNREDEWYEENVPGGLARAYALAMSLALESWKEACDG